MMIQPIGTPNVAAFPYHCALIVNKLAITTPPTIHHHFINITSSLLSQNQEMTQRFYSH
jgi:hypothetical protein